MADRLGQHIDDYRLIRLLGTGSYGEVYLGEHVHDQTLVAIKMLTRSQQNLKGFVNEVGMAFRLEHPHIIRPRALGISADDIPYLIMDYAPNGTLRQHHPKGKRLSLETIVSYLLPLAEALQYAHDKRVIHQDVKPENVLIGQDGQLLLSDFGIAVMVPIEKSLSTQKKEAGTLPYMAPEQFRRKPQPASDQYALGIMTYEWLCGVRPFDGASHTEFALHHLMDPPPPLRQRGIAISIEVEQVVLKALAKDPQERFPHVLDFATALQEAAHVGEPSGTLVSSRDTALQETQMPSQPDITQPKQVPPQPDITQPEQILFQPAIPQPEQALVTHPPSSTPPVILPATPLPSFHPSPPSQPIFIPSQPSAVRRGLTRKKLFLFVGLLLLIGSGSVFFSLFVINSLMNHTPFATDVMFGFDPAHTHWNPYEKVISKTNISRLKPAWSYATGGSIESSPAVANGIVYVGSNDKKLYAFDAACRKGCLPLWSYATGDSIESSPAVANGLVYVGSDDHKLYTFDVACRKDCLPLWSYATGGYIYSSPAVANGLVYVGSVDHKLYAFDAACRKDCLPLWSYAIGTWTSSPAVANGLVYVGSDDHKLYAFDAACRKNCLPLWSYATAGYIESSPAVANGLVYVGSYYDDKLYAFDAACRKDCLPLWSYATGNSIYSSPAVANGLVYVGSWDHKLYAFDATCRKDCLPLWSYATGNEILSSPAVANGLVYVGSDDGKLYAFGISAK